MPGHWDDRQPRDHRDLLRFMFQTSVKGQGKSFQDWLGTWRLSLRNSEHVQANSLEGVLVPVCWLCFCHLKRLEKR